MACSLFMSLLSVLMATVRSESDNLDMFSSTNTPIPEVDPVSPRDLPEWLQHLVDSVGWWGMWGISVSIVLCHSTKETEFWQCLRVLFRYRSLSLSEDHSWNG